MFKQKACAGYCTSECTHCMSDKPVDSLPVACHGFSAHPRQNSDPQHQARLHRLCKATKGLSLRLRDFTRPSLQLLNNHVAAHGLQKYPAHTVPSAGPLTAKGGGPWSWRQAPCPSCHAAELGFARITLSSERGTDALHSFIHLPLRERTRRLTRSGGKRTAQGDPMPAQPLRAAEAAASGLLAAVEAHSPDAVNQIRQHLVPAVAHFSVRPSVMMTHGIRSE